MDESKSPKILGIEIRTVRSALADWRFIYFFRKLGTPPGFYKPKDGETIKNREESSFPSDLQSEQPTQVFCYQI